MIFGNKPGSNMTKSGSQSFFSDGSITTRMGNTMYDGLKISVQTDNALFTPNGIVSHTGNAFYTNKGLYTRSGNTLFGPNGAMWSGIESDDDCLTIINHDLK